MAPLSCWLSWTWLGCHFNVGCGETHKGRLRFPSDILKYILVYDAEQLHFFIEPKKN